MRLVIVLFLSFFNVSTFCTQAEEINIAVASNFNGAMKAIVTEFEKSFPHKVHVSYGSSGKFYAQIKHGAPFQLFFSADQAKPLRLEQEQLTVEASRFTYAVGALVLWSSKKDFLVDGLNRLKSGDYNKLAIANPKLAPYGVAAAEVLASLKLEKLSRSKLVQGENIAQVYQFVGTGNADLGFVALSQVLANNHRQSGSSWAVPTDLHKPIKQDVVLLKRGEKSVAAKQLLSFIKSEQARGIIESYGYTTAVSLAVNKD